EVVRLVDDRLDVLFELGDVATIVPPGGTICNDDVGLTASYEVQPADAGQTIANNAVVTVRTTEDTPRTYQQTATAQVDVPLVALAADMVCAGGPADQVWDGTVAPDEMINLGNGRHVVVAAGTY